jgi:REP element-mobilizing transposase RayT
MTRTRYRVLDNAYPHFLTCTIVGWLPVFTRPEAVQIIFDSWSFLRNENRLEIFGYVILENHLHLIASSPDLEKEIGDFKSYTARQIIDLLEVRNARTLLEQLARHKARHKTNRTYQVWQEGSHPEQIHSNEMMWQKLEYMHFNPVKRGYVVLPEHWRYSSASNYLGLGGVFPVRTDWQ